MTKEEFNNLKVGDYIACTEEGYYDTTKGKPYLLHKLNSINPREFAYYSDNCSRYIRENSISSFEVVKNKTTKIEDKEIVFRFYKDGKFSRYFYLNDAKYLSMLKIDYTKGLFTTPTDKDRVINEYVEEIFENRVYIHVDIKG